MDPSFFEKEDAAEAARLGEGGASSAAAAILPLEGSIIANLTGEAKSGDEDEKLKKKIHKKLLQQQREKRIYKALVKRQSRKQQKQPAKEVAGTSSG
jgi:hypothetical protein